MKERAYLREMQYRDDTNLNARSALHERFSVNPVGLQRWVFDQLDLPARARILEVGCGPGNLWVPNLTRIPEGWQIVLSDFSPGMVQAARRRLTSRRFAFEVAEAEAVPHGAGTFDAVIANHMLYHVSNRRRAIAEFGEVLKPGGAQSAGWGKPEPDIPEPSAWRPEAISSALPSARSSSATTRTGSR